MCWKKYLIQLDVPIRADVEVLNEPIVISDSDDEVAMGDEPVAGMSEEARAAYILMGMNQR